MDSTKTKMVTANREQMIGVPLKWFSIPSEYKSAEIVLNKVFADGKPRFHVYNIKGYTFLYLFDRISDDVIAAHEVIDDQTKRPELKKFLDVAAKNFNKYINKDVG